MYRLCFFLLLVASRLYAQDPSDSTITARKNSIGLSIGAVHHRVIDEALTASKLKFKGTIPALELNYQHRYQRSILVASAYGALGYIHTPDESLSSSMQQFRLGCSFLNNIHQNNKRTGLFIGGELSSMWYMRYDEKQLNNLSFLLIHGLFLHVKDEYRINKRSMLIAEIHLPGLMFIKRESGDGGANLELAEEIDNPGQILFSNTYLAGPNPATYLRYRLGYEYAFSSRASFTVDYSFSWVNEYSNGTLKMYSNQLLAALKFKF
jgi:hypothetical protein